VNPLDVCVACNTAMLAVEPDQITHPCCDPDDTPLPVLSVDEINTNTHAVWRAYARARARSCPPGRRPATRVPTFAAVLAEADIPWCRMTAARVASDAVTHHCRG
jgi:hypothetical protein